MNEEAGPASPQPTERQLATRFQPGQSGNPAGSRAKCRYKLSEAFVRALWLDFQEHGADAIARVRESRPQDYLKIIALLVPQQEEGEAGQAIGVVVFNGLNDDETLARKRQELLGSSPAGA